jgi:hypothetical protein
MTWNNWIVRVKDLGQAKYFKFYCQPKAFAVFQGKKGENLKIN